MEKEPCKKKKLFPEQAQLRVSQLNYLRQPKKHEDRVTYIYCHECKGYHIRFPQPPKVKKSPDDLLNQLLK